MGQTLTHGVYLPDEGERNCYSGLAANWQILDGSVGTIAAHTAALSGKAPLVHTHTKSDITDFPAYGNAAGTICEGNDSRLSDARTPVAHTHGKADVTDLFNSANEWSGYNTFTDYVVSRESAAIPAGGYGKGVAFQDYQSNRLGYIQPHLTSDNAKRLLIGADSGDIAINSSLIPHVNNTYNLGSSSYQWNNLYAKNYYYNGVAWGLDKANVWTQNNEYKYLIGLSGAEIWFKQPNIEDITANPDANISKSIIKIYNKTATQYSGGISDSLRTDGSHRIVISCFGFPLNNYAGYYPHTFYFEAKRDGTASFSPSYTNASLGTSTNKWKTLNGINPGALSLPRGYTEEGADKHYINIASTIQTLDGTLYYYTMPDNGWISVRAEQANQVHVTTDNWKFGQSIYSNTVTTLIASTPFRKGDTVAIKVIATTLEHARFYPMQGNV